MSRSLNLENFAELGGNASDQVMPTTPTIPADDGAALDAYESGYKNGWADCSVAEAQERNSVSADLAKRIGEAHLTYKSAREDILGSLAPFFEEVVATLLPRLAAEAVAPVAVAELRILLEQFTDADVKILAAPGSCVTLQRLVDIEGFPSVTIESEPAFSDCQVSLRAGAERRDIDLAEVSAKITEAINAFQSHLDQTHPDQGSA